MQVFVSAVLAIVFAFCALHRCAGRQRRSLHMAEPDVEMAAAAAAAAGRRRKGCSTREEGEGKAKKAKRVREKEKARRIRGYR